MAYSLAIHTLSTEMAEHRLKKTVKEKETGEQCGVSRVEPVYGAPSATSQFLLCTSLEKSSAT